ncbi:hypothetical protein BK774_29950 [Bacillus thuringiensis]|uniref:Uncharacterized protein n=1 Tax=Bacillus thuringiensis TaxID=1428 RepID=A0A9X6KBS4_BACTU|nr:hypothetical protein BK759_09880 [Bacillus thuringiensis serovar aizawai]OTZ94809.1 hypothetical protein BK774_29950 [Bacillus thuringiensis]
MKPVRVYFVCSFLRGLYCLKVCSFQLMENRRVSILKLMGMGVYHEIHYFFRRTNCCFLARLYC